jgi:predicted DNA-binding helix-hairpin-helix protein
MKSIPGCSQQLVHEAGLYADRMSVNIELPSQKSLETLAPDKTKTSIIRPMGLISDKIKENKYELIIIKVPCSFHYYYLTDEIKQ